MVRAVLAVTVHGETALGQSGGTGHLVPVHVE